MPKNPLPKPILGRNGAALERALQALAVGVEHAALVEAARSLAEWVDASPMDDSAWREYRLALRYLMEATASGSSDAFNDFLDDLRAKVPDGADAES